MSFVPFNSHTNELFIDLKLVKVRDLIDMSHLKLVYDFLNNRLPTDLRSLFRLASDVHTTTRELNSVVNNLIYVPAFKTITYGKSSLRYKCAKLWNETFKSGDIQIDTDERKKLSKINNVKGFKDTIKKHFLYSYTVDPNVIYY